MANYLAQFQTIKSSCDRLIIAVEDVSDLWPSVKEGFEERLPLKKALLSNKTRNTVNVENLSAEFILTTDSRLRSRFSQELSVFWFREPYATVVLVTCEDLDEFKTILKPRLKLIVQNDEREWFIVFVSKAHPNNDQATKMAKKIYARLQVDFNSKKRERCCKLDLQGPDANFWEDLDSKIVESIRNSLDRRIQFYEEEIRKLTEQRFMPVWSFCNFFILKESLAFMFEMAHLFEDALREYDELELCYLETGKFELDMKTTYMDIVEIFRGILKDSSTFIRFSVLEDGLVVYFDKIKVMNGCVRKNLEFPQLLFKLFRAVEVASRGYSFIINFSKTLALYENFLPFCFREVWVITACLAMIKSTASHFDGSHATADGKEFFRLQGDLYSLSRVKAVRAEVMQNLSFERWYFDVERVLEESEVGIGGVLSLEGHLMVNQTCPVLIENGLHRKQASLIVVDHYSRHPLATTTTVVRCYPAPVIDPTAASRRHQLTPAAAGHHHCRRPPPPTIITAGRCSLHQFSVAVVAAAATAATYATTYCLQLLFKLFRAVEVASRGYSFIINFSKTLALYENFLPFCFREVWVITACLAIINSTASHFDGSHATADGKEFFRLQGDLYSLSRVKFMRLAYLIGYGVEMERSPVNSASLSMLPWPKPAVWPLVPPEASADVLEKEKMVHQSSSRVKHFNIERKPLPLEPSLLLREANRRRASLSVGNASELFDGRWGDGSGLDGHLQFSPAGKVHANLMSRTLSGPANSENSSLSFDRPMRLWEIHVAAEHALKRTISDPDLLKSISSLPDFEKKYMELTKGAADNYHQSWWKRHGVVLDGEIGALCLKHGNYDLAAKSYEKVCALYAGEGWQDLLAEVLPNLAECQKILNDQAGYLSSCVRLLSLDNGLFSTKERQVFQSEVVRLAHGEMKHPVPLDVSSLITFSGNPGPPLELCDGDPGTLAVTVWSGFPDDIALESLSLTLMSTFSTDEGVKDIKSSDAPVLKRGHNLIMLELPPQKPGSYVLGVLTGQIGQLRFRSHSFSKGGPPDSDDFMSYEKPTRPVLKVHKPRPLVDITAAASSTLLINEVQWVGLVVSPMNYSLKGAILHIDTGPGLIIEESHMIEMEHYRKATDHMVNCSGLNIVKEDACLSEVCEKLLLENGQLAFPDWAGDLATVLWLPVRAIDNMLARGTSSVNPSRHSVVDGMRMIALKLQFGVFHNQIFERTIAVHFSEPFHVSTHVVDKCNDGTLLLQVLIYSQVKASMKLCDAWLDLQPGFVHVGKSDGRPTSSFFPFVVSPSSRAAILFVICVGNISRTGMLLFPSK
ncbi:trafficking protein particle complex II-specific subunit 130 homolog [Dendrobium catenatum]|uniref:trafficking protein particle complex II-specific subunit 130 homolog n=1 Tax=Dendrobium catenatum TaxID=906689 RepID=UPI0010A07A7C|nr:trafficking protein particle complex II-specific subunit 130 homolog [Dendrobium catenatum]